MVLTVFSGGGLIIEVVLKWGSTVKRKNGRYRGYTLNYTGGSRVLEFSMHELTKFLLSTCTSVLVTAEVYLESRP